MTNKSNQDKELSFGRNFFRRRESPLTEEQKQELAIWEAEICGVALRPAAVDNEYNRLLEILESRKSDLRSCGKKSLKDCFMTNKSLLEISFQSSASHFCDSLRFQADEKSLCQQRVWRPWLWAVRTAKSHTTLKENHFNQNVGS